jgi:hypothetical protein
VPSSQAPPPGTILVVDDELEVAGFRRRRARCRRVYGAAGERGCCDAVHERTGSRGKASKSAARHQGAAYVGVHLWCDPRPRYPNCPRRNAPRQAIHCGGLVDEVTNPPQASVAFRKTQSTLINRECPKLLADLSMPWIAFTEWRPPTSGFLISFGGKPGGVGTFYLGRAFGLGDLSSLLAKYG